MTKVFRARGLIIYLHLFIFTDRNREFCSLSGFFLWKMQFIRVWDRKGTAVLWQGHTPSSMASFKRGSVGCSVVLLFAPFFRCRMTVKWEVRPTGYLIPGRKKQRAVLQALQVPPWLTARQKSPLCEFWYVRMGIEDRICCFAEILGISTDTHITEFCQ